MIIIDVEMEGNLILDSVKHPICTSIKIERVTLVVCPLCPILDFLNLWSSVLVLSEQSQNEEELGLKNLCKYNFL